MVKYCLNITIIVFISLIIIISSCHLSEAGDYQQFQEKLYNWFKMDSPYYLQEYDVILHTGVVLKEVYNENNYSPLWFTDVGMKGITGEFIELLENSEVEGLFPRDYNLPLIKSCLLQFDNSETEKKIKDLIQLDLLLTNAFFIYTSDLIKGRLNEDKEERKWVKEEILPDVWDLLRKVIRDNDISQLENAVSRLPEYRYLKKMYIKYREIKKEGGWPRLKLNKVLELGDSGLEVEILRERLEKEPGSITNFSEENRQIFDQECQQAVFNFQHRYGLVLTGKVDADTRRALNLSCNEIIDKIIINLERLRHIKQDSEGSYIIVNIPEFQLNYIEKGRKVWESRVVVGDISRKTPVFSSRITNLLFNPRWYIPYSIAVNDFLPRLKKDISYLEEKNIRVYVKEDNHFQEVDPGSISWTGINEDDFRYYLWQDSGPGNALGQVIFRSPNKQHIYLHDTSEKELFGHNVRTYSSGCVRVQNALDLASHILNNYTNKSREDMESILTSGREIKVFLKETLPVHFVYLTVRSVGENEIKILRDIYNKDEELIENYLIKET